MIRDESRAQAVASGRAARLARSSRSKRCACWRSDGRSGQSGAGRSGVGCAAGSLAEMGAAVGATPGSGGARCVPGQWPAGECGGRSAAVAAGKRHTPPRARFLKKSGGVLVAVKYACIARRRWPKPVVKPSFQSRLPSSNARYNVGSGLASSVPPVRRVAAGSICSSWCENRKSINSGGPLRLTAQPLHRF